MNFLDYFNSMDKKKRNLFYTLIFVAVALVIYLMTSAYISNKNSEKLYDVSVNYEKAMIANQNANVSKSEKNKLFNKVIDEAPKSAFAIFSSWYLADNYMGAKSDSVIKGTGSIGVFKYTKAIDVLENSIENNQKNNLSDITRTRLARVYLASGFTDKAIDVLSQIKNQDNAYVCYLTAQAYAGSDIDKAKDFYKKALDNVADYSGLKKLITISLNNLG